MSLHDETLVGLVEKRRSAEELGRLPRRVRRFYEQQNSLIDAYVEAITVRAGLALPPNARRGGDAAALGAAASSYEDESAVEVKVDDEERGRSSTDDADADGAPTDLAGGVPRGTAVVPTAVPSTPVAGAASPREPPQPEHQTRAERSFISGSFACNVVLFGVKLVFALMTGSVAVLTSTLDSALDLLSGLIVFWTARAIRRTDRYTFPQGKARLEPLAIIVFASVMGVSALHIIMDATVDLVGGFVGGNGGAYLSDVTYTTYLALGGVVAVKSGLWAVGRVLVATSNSPSVEALTSDHRNDVLSNTVSAAALVAATSVSSLWWLDAVSGVAMAAFIVYNWGTTGWGHVQQLTGLAAPRTVVNRLTFIAATHDPRITFVDTVRAYYFGSRVFAEVDIGLPEDMPLREAHDIGESLQHKLETDEDVERAFVHIDYEYAHDPALEHAM